MSSQSTQVTLPRYLYKELTLTLDVPDFPSYRIKDFVSYKEVYNIHFKKGQRFTLKKNSPLLTLTICISIQ